MAVSAFKKKTKKPADMNHILPAKEPPRVAGARAALLAELRPARGPVPVLFEAAACPHVPPSSPPRRLSDLVRPAGRPAGGGKKFSPPFLRADKAKHSPRANQLSRSRHT